MPCTSRAKVRPEVGLDEKSAYVIGIESALRRYNRCYSHTAGFMVTLTSAVMAQKPTENRNNLANSRPTKTAKVVVSTTKHTPNSH